MVRSPGEGWGPEGPQTVGPEEWGAEPRKSGGPKEARRVGGPKFRAFFTSPFFSSWICGLGSRPWSTQVARLGSSGVILCEPRRIDSRQEVVSMDDDLDSTCSSVVGLGRHASICGSPVGSCQPLARVFVQVALVSLCRDEPRQGMDAWTRLCKENEPSNEQLKLRLLQQSLQNLRTAKIGNVRTAQSTVE